MNQPIPLAFQPESEESAKGRFKEIFTSPFLLSGPESEAECIRAVRRQRKHIFDFPDGLRLMACVQQEKGDNDKFLHLCFTVEGEENLPPAKFVERVRFLAFTFAGNLQFVSQAWLPPNQPTAKSYHAFFLVK